MKNILVALVVLALVASVVFATNAPSDGGKTCHSKAKEYAFKACQGRVGDAYTSCIESKYLSYYNQCMAGTLPDGPVEALGAFER